MEDPRACRRRWLSPLLAVVGVVGAGRAADADLIYFRGGGEAQLPTTVDGNRIVLLLPDEKLELRREDIVKRVPGFWPADEWDARRREAQAAGFASRYATAWWAIENGLTIEAVPEVRALHALDPEHGPSSRMAAVLDRLDRPCPDPDIAAFRAALGIEGKVARGPHVLLLHQHSEAEAAERVAVLERVILGFHLLFAAQGVELQVPRRRLVSAWFGDRGGLPGVPAPPGSRRFRDDRRLFPPDVGRGRRLRRAERRRAACGAAGPGGASGRVAAIGGPARSDAGTVEGPVEAG